MEKKKEIKKNSLIKESIQDKVDSPANKVLIISQFDRPKESEYNYLISIDSTIKQGTCKDENYIHICIHGSDIRWAQKYLLINLIKELQSKGAANVERYDKHDPKKINPVFNLSHLLVKFGVK